MRAYLLTTTATMALLAVLSMPAQAQVRTWISPFAGDWTNPTNWNPGFVPTAADDAVINKGGTTALVTTSGATARSLTLGQSSGDSGTVAMGPGDGSTTIGGVIIGLGGTGTLTIADGGTLTDSMGAVGGTPGSQGVVTVTGAGSTWTNTATLQVGGTSIGTLTIATGGTVTSVGGAIGIGGAGFGSTGTVLVTGQGSSWTDSAGITVGGFTGGNGTLTVADGGTVRTGTVFLALGNGSTGTVNIGAAPGSPAVAPGTLDTPAVVFQDGTATLNFNHTSTNYVFAPAISGNGAVNALAGTTILTANNTYTGATTINGGALIVNGSIASSSLTTVNSGAALLGSGTVGSTVVNTGGFLVPGPVGTPGTMTVTGNLAFQSGALYVVQVNPTTASNTNVSGTASLAGTVGAIFAPGSYMVRSYTILTSGGRIGTFDALATPGLPAGFQASLSYPGNNVLLNLTARLVPEPPTTPPTTPTPPTTIPPVPGLPPLPPQTSAPLPPFTVNEINVGHAIDNFFNNGGALPPAFVPLFGLTGSNLTYALDQLSGEAATGAQKVAFQLTDQFLNLMLDPFVDGRSGVGGTDHPALGFAPERETMPPDIALAYASVFKGPRRRYRSMNRAGRCGVLVMAAAIARPAISL